MRRRLLMINEGYRGDFCKIKAMEARYSRLHYILSVIRKSNNMLKRCRIYGRDSCAGIFEQTDNK